MISFSASYMCHLFISDGVFILLVATSTLPLLSALAPQSNTSVRCFPGAEQSCDVLSLTQRHINSKKIQKRVAKTGDGHWCVCVCVFVKNTYSGRGGGQDILQSWTVMYPRDGVVLTGLQPSS